jgi:hypothetical protein
VSGKTRQCSKCKAIDYFEVIRDGDGKPYTADEAFALYHNDRAKYDKLFAERYPEGGASQAEQVCLVPTAEGLVCTHCLKKGKADA